MCEMNSSLIGHFKGSVLSALDERMLARTMKGGGIHDTIGIKIFFRDAVISIRAKTDV